MVQCSTCGKSASVGFRMNNDFVVTWCCDEHYPEADVKLAKHIVFAPRKDELDA